jgi:gamma-glutamyl hercynylcysteine S-oxide hydrolase
MCRHLAFIGDPLPISRLFHDAPHSLEHQSYAPREMLEGHVNADGFAVAWWPPVDKAGSAVGTAGDPTLPLVYRSERPAWAGLVFKGLARRLLGRVVVANVRNATDPATGGLMGVHPYTEGRWAFTHNGYLSGFREHLLRPMGALLGDKRYRARKGSNDTETLFLLLMDQIDQGSSGEEAISWLVEECVRAVEKTGQPGFLNFLLSNGETVWATRMSTKPRQASLYVGHGLGSFPEGTVIASEALDEDPGWQVVPESSLVVARHGEPPQVKPLL